MLHLIVCHFFTFTLASITKSRLFKYKKNSPPKTEIFQVKNFDIFHISAQNIDCEYSLEPPRHRLGEAVLTSTHNLCF